MERILAQKKELQYTLSDEVTRLADELLLQCRMLSIHKVIAKRVSLVERALLKNLEASFQWELSRGISSDGVDSSPQHIGVLKDKVCVIPNGVGNLGDVLAQELI